jgi:catechol 2,3-dioxygenase-like lactoylglutathione lyase family enzyme
MSDPGEPADRWTGEIDRSIYPMPQFVTFIVADVAASTRFYLEAVGFVVLAELPGLVHLRRWRHQDVLLVPGAAAPAPGVQVSLSTATDDDLQARARRAEALGGRVLEGPVRRPYNVTELVLGDPDGYRIVLVAPLPFDQMDHEFSARLFRGLPPPG